jgi:hypothetical protein
LNNRKIEDQDVGRWGIGTIIQPGDFGWRSHGSLCDEYYLPHLDMH